MTGGLCRWPPNTFWKKMVNDRRRIKAEFNGNSTRYHSNTVALSCPRSLTTPSYPSTTYFVLSSVPARLFDTKSCPEFTARFTQHIQRRKQDLTPINQNTRSKTRRHSTSCILVLHLGHNHGNHPRRLKSPIHQTFTVLDPFYTRHFAFPFGLPAVPYCHGGPNVQRWISPTTHPQNISSWVHLFSYATTTTIRQGQNRIWPCFHPLCSP